MFAPVAVDVLQLHGPHEWCELIDTHQIDFGFEMRVSGLHHGIHNVFIGDGLGVRHHAAKRHIKVPIVAQNGLQACHIPLFFHRFFGHKLAHQIGEAAFAQAGNLGCQVLRVQDVIALLVNHFALVVGHIVVFQQLLANIEIARLYFALGALNTSCDHACLDGFAFGHLQAVHDGFDTLTGKNAHQRIIQAQVKT